MKNFLRVLATGVLFLLAWLMILVFFGLFFYEVPISLTQVAIQGGAQFLLFTLLYLIVLILQRLWCPKRG